ncbi:regulator of telomere elongation helicase 1 homolog isoform X2 [Solanum pennellii]|uniref:Regulator of telomere elongation helicase 1 homolog isoform X2 n=1 Tax=Solanum pennellii TaxID=28526 RepID=A0ABM1GHS1_SOLPN|nr:regulator of telomere elongation helicase 1 homolog isoform X2 [Solanum pennellii]
MPIYKIRGIDVDFPYEAYDCQIAYMEKVIQSLQNRSNALLESPTGTGKTLCLLCATLAWRKSLGGFSVRKSGRRDHISSSQQSDESSQSESSTLPSIVYASRTHSQIRQVVKELKRTNYRPKMVVLGSREQLCIHEEVSQLRGKTQTNACHALCKKRKKRYCAHFSRVAEFMKINPSIGEEPIDIEDLVNIGRSSGPCPYYVSRELHKTVDILFAPYNYLIDRGYRKSLNIQWTNSILIFDEAHNLESLCADAASFDLSSGLLTACISEAKNCIDLSIERREMSSDKSCNPDNFAILRALLLKLEKKIGEVPIDSKELGFTKPGPYIYEFLADLNITQKTANMLIDIIEEATVLLEEDTNTAEDKKTNKSKSTVCRLESMGDILQQIFRDDGNPHAQYYRVHVQEVQGNGMDSFKGKGSRTLSWWCFNPGIAMEQFSRLGVGSIILTSGTLSPMDSFADELKLDFPVRLENPHVISDNQIWAGAVPVGPSGYTFNSSYRTRDSIEYKQELGNAIVNFARVVPDGLLVFFPSYYILEQCIGCWKTLGQSISMGSSTIWERICKHKLPVVEPRQSSLFPTAIEDYMAKLKDKSASGAVFFAVCRGKVSEGLDFTDHAGRAVVITGIPFATRTDPKVRLKREFLDQQMALQPTGSKVLTGEDWYTQQATRAVNQAVGRVIRHKDDFGAIIFCDERFTYSNRQSQISRWIQPHIKCHSKFGEVVFSLTRFFRDGRIHGPTKPEMMLPDDKETVKSVGSSQSQLHFEKLLTSLVSSVDIPCSTNQSSSSVKQGNGPGGLEDILPANKSSLRSDKIAKLLAVKHASNLLVPGRKDMPISNQKIIDLTKHELADEPPKDVFAPCSTKRPRLALTGSDCQSDHFRKPHDSPDCSSVAHHLLSESDFRYLLNNKKSQYSDNQSTRNSNLDRANLLEDERTSRKTAGLVDLQNEDGILSSAPCNNEEKGSAFLVQVREKLTDTEYHEFVGYMKSLKSKAMKIGQVLQSITRLFSLPDRLPLLHRFKDYVPAKYHSLYDQYLKRNQEVAHL